jgi:hypothetical protein
MVVFALIRAKEFVYPRANGNGFSALDADVGLPGHEHYYF